MYSQQYPQQPPQNYPSPGKVLAAIVVAVLAICGAMGVVYVIARNLGVQVPAVSSDNGVKLADKYEGTAHNRTAEQMGFNGTSKITVEFTDKNPQALRGKITVVGASVGGTGLFDAVLTGNNITFAIHPTDGTPPYGLTGMVAADGTMSGALTVPPNEGVAAQSGDWTLKPVD